MILLGIHRQVLHRSLVHGRQMHLLHYLVRSLQVNHQDAQRVSLQVRLP